MENYSWPGWQTTGLLDQETYGKVYEICREVGEKTEKAALKVIPIPLERSMIAQLRKGGHDDESITRILEKQAASLAAEYVQGQKAGAGASAICYDDIRYIRSENELGGNLLIKMQLPAQPEKAESVQTEGNQPETPEDEIRIRFLLSDGRVISEHTYQRGDAVTVPRMKAEILTAKAKYVFKGWSAEVAPNAVESVDYVALYQKVPVPVATGTTETTGNGPTQGTNHANNKLGVWVAVVAAVVVIALLAMLFFGFKDRIQDLFEDFPQSLFGGGDNEDDGGDSDGDDDRHGKKECSHHWLLATCTEPQVCSECGQTRGSSKGHDWLPATCTQPQTCTQCGQTQGEAAEHDWELPTRTAPKTCVICGATEGEPLPPPDVSVDWQVQYIGNEYAEIEELLYSDELYREEVSREVYYYYDFYGDIRMVVTAKGNDGIGEYSDQYRRYYYFDNGKLIFAFFEGQDCHRMYFYEGQLMRWRYQGVGQSKSDAVNEDFTYSDEFLKWESLALQEVEGFGVI